MRGREVHLITKELEIGRPVAHPTLVGEWAGCTVWNLETQQGLFLVKCFNPQGGLLQEIKDQYNFGESWARELEKAGAPVLPALVRGEEALLEIYGQGFLIISLSNREVLEDAWSQEIGMEVGTLLAQLHSQSGIEEAGTLASCFMKKEDNKNSALWLEKERTEKNYKVLCHGALTPEKLLRGEKGELLIAHWEEACLLPPLAELLSVAIIWGQEEERLEKQKVEAILRAYQAGGGNLRACSLEEAKRAWIVHQERRAQNINPEEEGIEEETGSFLQQWENHFDTASQILETCFLN